MEYRQYIGGGMIVVGIILILLSVPAGATIIGLPPAAFADLTGLFLVAIGAVIV